MTLKQFGVWAILAFLLIISNLALATLLTFEDLQYNQILSGQTYHGLFFEYGNTGSYGKNGNWICPAPSTNSDSFHCPQSGTHNLSNGWGCTEIGILFPELVDVLSIYFSVQGYSSSWTKGIRVHGYRDGIEVGQTEWLTEISTVPVKLDTTLLSVDRIVIKSKPANPDSEEDYHYGWFGMDDLYYEKVIIPEPATLLMLGLGIIGIYRRK